MGAWAERRGFATTIVEWLFDAACRAIDIERSRSALRLDIALGGRADGLGFPFLIEAGLGRGHRNFRTIRMQTPPGTRTRAEI